MFAVFAHGQGLVLLSNFQSSNWYMWKRHSSDVIGNKGGEFTSVSMFDFTSVPKTLGMDAVAHDAPIDRVRICQGSLLVPTLYAM